MGVLKLSDNQLAYLKANYHQKTVKMLAEELQVNYTELSSLCTSIGLRKQNQTDWSELEIAFLKLNYKRIGDKELAEILTKLGYPRTLKMIEKRRHYSQLVRTPEMIEKIQKRNNKRGCYDWKILISEEKRREMGRKKSLSLKKTYGEGKVRVSRMTAAMSLSCISTKGGKGIQGIKRNTELLKELLENHPDLLDAKIASIRLNHIIKYQKDERIKNYGQS